jgi:hypothetical protein
MPASRLPALAILGAVALVAAGFALQQYQRAENLARQLARSSEETQDLSAELARQKTQAEDDGQTTKASSEEAVAVLAEQVAQSSTTSTSRSDRRRMFGERMRELMAEPKYARAYLLQQRSRLDNRYADLFAQLNLNPAELENLQRLLVDKQQTARDVLMAARELGYGRQDQEKVREMIESAQAEIDGEILAAIGEQNYAALQAYDQTGSQRALVNQLESRLSYTATPLNDAQAQALTSILARSGTTITNGGTVAVAAGFGSSNSLITPDVVAQAQAVLSPDQLNALTALQEEQEAARLIQSAMREMRNQVRNSPGGGG